MKLLLVILLIWFTLETSANAQPRVITLAPHLAEIVFALGAGEQLLATSEHTDYPETAAAIRTIGNSYSLNIETIISLQPDVILAWETGNPKLQLQRLEDLGVQIFYSKPESIQDLLAEINTIGRLLGTSEKSEILTSQLSQEIEQLSNDYKDKKPISLFYQIWHQPLRTLGNDPWLNQMLEICGGRNIFKHLKQPYPLVSYEAVLHKNPQAIIVPSKDNNPAETDHWQRWHQLQAIQKQQFMKINPDLLHRFTPRIPKGLHQLCTAIDKVRNNHAK